MNRKSFVAGVKALSAAVNSNLPAELAFYAITQIRDHGNKTELAELLLALSIDKGRRLGATGCLIWKYIQFNVEGIALHKKDKKDGKARQAETIAFREAAHGDIKIMARNISVNEKFGIRGGRLNAEGTAFCIGWQQFSLVEKTKAKPAAASKPATASSMLARINGIKGSLHLGLTCSSRDELAGLLAALASLQVLAEKAGNRYLQQIRATVLPSAPAAETPAAPAVEPAPAPAAKAPAAKALIGTAAVKRERIKRAAVAKRDSATAEKAAAEKATAAVKAAQAKKGKPRGPAEVAPEITAAAFGFVDKSDRRETA